MASAAAIALLQRPANRAARPLLGLLLPRRGLASAGAGESGGAASSSGGGGGGGPQLTSRQARRQQWLKEKDKKAAAAAAAGGEGEAAAANAADAAAAAPSSSSAAAGASAAAAAGEGAASQGAGAGGGGGAGSTALKVLGGGALIGGGYALYNAEATDAALRQSPVGGAYAMLYDAVFSPFINPSRDKLLPDWHAIPNIPPDAPCPPTLVLDLEDTLVHATWDPKYGWRYAKRPGVDRFLQDLAKYYEIVLFSPGSFGVVDPITWTLDKQGLIMHRLYKDSTRFYKGKHVKDLSCLNRDLRRVVIVDDDPDAFQFQPENGIRIKPFLDPKDKGDRSLDKLRKFLMAVVMEGVSDDIPAVLRQFRGLDADQLGDAYESRLRAAKLREAERHQKGLGGLLRSRKAFQGVAHPLPGSSEAGGAGGGKPKGLSAKDIVGGVDSSGMDGGDKVVAVGEVPGQHAQSAPPPAGPVKKGKLWERYQNYLKEAEEEQRRKMELWQRKQQQREEEARRQAMQQQAAR